MTASNSPARFHCWLLTCLLGFGLASASIGGMSDRLAAVSQPRHLLSFLQSLLYFRNGRWQRLAPAHNS